MKTFLRMFTLFFTLVYFSLSSTLPVSAEHLQKQQLKVMLVDGYSLISISELCKAVDATYHWDSKTKTISIKKDYLSFNIRVGEYTIKSPDGEKDDYLPIPAQIHSGRIMVPLRSLAEKPGAEVSMDSKSKTVFVRPTNAILIPDLEDTHVDQVSNRVETSKVQQFLYKNAVAYAFPYQNELTIKLPNHTLNLRMKYPLLGDIIADSDGYFYIIWGKEGSNYTEETIFITKISPSGQEIQTTGFQGRSLMGEQGNTKIPFCRKLCIRHRQWTTDGQLCT